MNPAVWFSFGLVVGFVIGAVIMYVFLTHRSENAATLNMTAGPAEPKKKSS